MECSRRVPPADRRMPHPEGGSTALRSLHTHRAAFLFVKSCMFLLLVDRSGTRGEVVDRRGGLRGDCRRVACEWVVQRLDSAKNLQVI